MCFFKGNKKARIAEQDIIVYKVGDAFGTHFISRFEKFCYTRKRLYKKSDKVIERASSRKELYDEVYHAYTTIEKAWDSFGEWHGVGDFVIPKGTVYWQDSKNNEIASTKIKYLQPHRFITEFK